LDEVDLGSNKLLCLQPILEGKGILLKKINQYVKPAPGFTIVATANTKGQGSETGKFVGTNILNEAFLERFCATFEQKYPEERVEKSILKKLFASHDLKSDVIDDFVSKLVTWAFGTRKTFETGGTSDLISTRRLVHIVNAYVILGHPDESDKKSVGDRRRQAIELCIARFDESTKISFMNFYENIDPYLTVDMDSKQDSVNESEELKAEEHDILSILTNQS
jgi:MoxR-like ATPase